jgi:hypothetical protein
VGIGVAGYLAAIAVSDQTHKSIAESIAQTQIHHLLSFDQLQIRGITIAMLIAGIISTVLAVLIARVVLWLIFLLSCRLTNFWGRVDAQVTNKPFDSFPIQERQALATFIDATLEGPRITIRRYRVSTEVCSGLSFMFFVAFIWGNLVDLAVAIFFAAACIVQTVQLIRYFHANFFGSALLLAQVQGRPYPKPD